MFGIKNETRRNKNNSKHNVDDAENDEVNGFDTAKEEMSIFQESYQAHDAECSEHPYHLEVLLCKEDR